MQKDFFKTINSDLKAYLLGFIVADGSIGIRTRNRGTEYSLSFSIHKRDKYIFDLFKDHVKDNINLGILNDTYLRFSIYGKDFIDNIMSHNVLPCKTYKEMNIPQMEDNLKIHFIRGYFDGDGTCVANITKSHFRKISSSWSYRRKSTFRIFSKKCNILSEIQSFFEDYSIKLNLNYLKSKDGYTLSSSSRENLSKIYNLFYNNSEFYLKRKEESFYFTTITSSEFFVIKGKEPCRA